MTKENNENVYFREGCFATIVENHAIILDLDSSEYAVADVRATGVINHIIHNGYHQLRQPNEAIKAMVDSGILLTSDKMVGRPQTNFPNPKLEVLGPLMNSEPKFAASIPSVAKAVWRASILLRKDRLTPAVSYLSKLRARRNKNMEFDESRIFHQIEIYRRCRPFFYSAQDRCTLNSLSLLIYLARFNCFPKWTFGIRREPFEAHCWIEDDNWLFNDVFPRISRFTRIASF